MIRREPLERSTMRSRKQRLLSILLREERTQAKISYFAYLDSVSDLAECRKLFELARTDMESDLNKNAEKVEVQLIFLKERIFRIATNTEAIINTRSLLLIDIDTIQREFNNFSVSNIELPVPKRFGVNEAVVHDGHDLNVNANRTNHQPLPLTNGPVTSSPIVTVSNAHDVVPPSQTIGERRIINDNSHFVEEVIRNPFDVIERPLINLGPMSMNTNPNGTPLHPCINDYSNRFHQSSQNGNRNSAQIWKWGIKYSSDDKTKSASEFVQRLQDLAKSRNVPLDELLPSMPELLEGTAAQWFRTNSRSNPFRTFSDFVIRFLEDFEPYYKVDTRLELLKKRLQKQDESIVAFFAHVENEFLTMAFRPDEAEQVKIIRRNLLPHYINALALSSFNTVQELKEACKKLELGTEIVKYQNINRVSNLANSGPLRYNGLHYSRPNGLSNQDTFPDNPNRAAPIQQNQSQFKRDHNQPQRYGSGQHNGSSSNNFNRNTSMPIHSVPMAAPFGDGGANAHGSGGNNHDTSFRRANVYESNPRPNHNPHNATVPNYNNFQHNVQNNNRPFQPTTNRNNYQNRNQQQNNAVNSIEISSPLIPSQVDTNVLASVTTPDFPSLSTTATNRNPDSDHTVVEVVDLVGDEITTQELIETTTDAIAQLYSTANDERFNVSFIQGDERPTLPLLSPMNIKSIINDCRDNRPIAEVKIKDQKVHCLLDSGANVSIAGEKGMNVLRSLGFLVDRSQRALITTADKTAHTILGSYLVPIEFRGHIEVIRFLACPSIDHAFILGVDFWKAFEVRVQNKNGVWSCAALELQATHVDGIGIRSMEALNEHERNQVALIVERFETLSNDNILGRTNILEQDIDTGNAIPTVQRYYPVAPAVQQRMHKELDRMIELDVVEPSKSPWRSPVVLVKKANGKDRLCIDSRKVNEVTKHDSYPLPYISSILDRLGKTNFLTSIDLKDAFWQIPLTMTAREKTAFVIPGRGLWQMKVMPFGLRNSAQAMQRLVDRIFYGLEFIFTYLDDIIVATETFEGHLNVLNAVYERLKDANLTINFDKCQFCRPSLRYLGFVVDRDGLHTDPKKIEAIQNYPRPRNTTEVKRFIGLASWYRRFIRDFATIAAPIHDVVAGVQKGKPIKWTSEAEMAFDKLKSCLSTSPVLATPKFNSPFAIHCDASLTGIGAVLCQGDDEAPIAYASRKLSPSERNYSTTERECLAVVFGVEKFRAYVEGSEFMVVTDHASLLWLLRQQNLPQMMERWALRLSPYTFTVVHRKGSSNVVPDALSRAFECETRESRQKPDPYTKQTDTMMSSTPTIAVLDCTPTADDHWYGLMQQKLKNDPMSLPDWKVKDDQLYIRVKPKVGVTCGYIYKKVVPESMRKSVLNECHDMPTAAHLGIRKTKERVAQRYFWPSLSHDVQDYVKNCSICRESKVCHGKKQGLMGRYKMATSPFQMISLDFVGPLTPSSKQNTVILVITDWFTKYISCFALRKATASKVVQILEEQIFLTYGVPEIIIMDNGKQFAGKELKRLLETYDIQKVWFNSYYHAQNNFTERYNQTLGNCLRAFAKKNQRHWDVNLPKIQLALRTAVHEVTGYTPFYLNFGREYVHSGNEYHELHDDTEETKDYSKFLIDFKEIAKEVQEKMLHAYEKNRKRYNSNRVHVTFKVGEKVYRKNFAHSDASKHISAKLNPKYLPFVVSNKRSDVSYDLVDEDGKFVGNYHVKDIFKA